MRTIQEDQASVFHRILRALRPFEVGSYCTADRCNVTGGMINMLQPFFLLLRLGDNWIVITRIDTGPGGFDFLDHVSKKSVELLKHKEKLN